MKLYHLFEDVSQGVELPAYRGLTRPAQPGQTVVEFPVRKDRRPMEMTPIFSAVFNYAFQQQFGITDIRKGCVFASTNIDVANEYAGGEQGDANGAVVQLVVPPTAVIFYNPRVGDSLYLEEEKESFGEFVEALGDLSEHGDPLDDIGLYMSKTSDNYLAEIIKLASQDDQERYNELLSMLNQVAADVGHGYKKVTPQQFAATGGSDSYIEVMVTNISSYHGAIISDETTTDS